MKRNPKRSRRRPSVRSQMEAEPQVSIVGAGRLGTALGLALRNAGYRIGLVVANHLSTARRAANMIEGSPIALASGGLKRLNSKEAELLTHSSVVLIATPDDVIHQVAEQLAFALERAGGGGDLSRARVAQTVLHTSGALSSNELRPLKGLGCATGSLHPLISISDPRSGSDAFRGAFFCVEGSATAVRTAKAVARKLGGETFAIASENKPLYHAAAVMASGNVVALFDLAIEMLQRCGVSRRRSRQVLLPLLESSIKNLQMADPKGALTGPFARGDVATIRRHLAAIESRNLKSALSAYTVLGDRSLYLAKRPPRRPATRKQLSGLPSVSRKSRK